MATTYAVSAGDLMRPYERCRIKHFPEDASQSFKAGEVVIAGGAGVENKIKVAANDPTAAIVGVALEDATGVTGNLIPVACAEPGALFIARALAGVALDYTSIGAARAVEEHASITDLWVVDTGDAGNDSVVPRFYRSPTGAALAEGDFEMEVIFSFVEAATIWGSAT